jgi:hypothetical protein
MSHSMWFQPSNRLGYMFDCWNFVRLSGFCTMIIIHSLSNQL